MTTAKVFRPRPLVQVTPTLLYCPESEKLLDFASRADLGHLLSHWREFADLDSVAMRLLGISDIGEIARRFQRRGSRLDRWIVQALTWLRTHQLTSVAADPRFTDVRARLSALVEDGTLVSETVLLGSRSHVGARGPSLETLSLQTVGVITRERPETLRQCLKSLLENARLFGRTVRLYVMDFSDPGPYQLANRHVLEALRKEYRVSITHANRRDSERLSTAIQERGVPTDVSDFGLAPRADSVLRDSGYGAARNFLLQALAGEVMLLMDDVIVCSLIPRPERRSDIHIVYDGSTHYSAAADGSSARGDKLGLSGIVDFIGVHEAVLGRTLPEVIASHGPTAEVTIGELCDHLFTCLEHGLGRVAASGCGVSTPKIASSGDAVPRARRDRRSRSVWYRGVAGTTISHHWGSPVPILGLDNRMLLPPFIPGCSLDVAAFPATFERAFDDVFAAQLPWAAPYAGAEDVRAPWPLMGGDILTLDEVIASCVLPIDTYGTGDSAERLRRMGKGLQELATVEGADFEEQLRLRVWGWCSDELRRRTVSGATRPVVDPWISARCGAITTRAFIVPRELRVYSDVNQALQVLRQFIRECGQLLERWSDVTAAASDVLNHHDGYCGTLL